MVRYILTNRWLSSTWVKKIRIFERNMYDVFLFVFIFVLYFKRIICSFLENLETRSWGEVKLFATQTWGLEFRPPEIQRNVRWAWRPVFLIPSLESRDKGFPRASYLVRVAIASRSECDWESLPWWIRWKSHWGWFLPGSLGSTCTSTFVHM